MYVQRRRTPLHYATAHGHSEVINILIAANAEVNRMDMVSC